MGHSAIPTTILYGIGVTFVLMMSWTYPLVSTTWHDKQWFFGPAGLGAVVTMEIGLTSYRLEACCECPSLAKAIKLMCNDSGSALGTHDLSELMDLSCNAQETTKGLIQGCDTTKMLYYVSLGTAALICISLIPMVAGCFGMLYFELGYHDTYETKAFCTAMYYAAPCLQLVAIGMYGLCTHQLDDMFSPQMLQGLFPVNLVLNSPKVVTLATGYAIAGALCAMCFVLPCFTVHYLTVSKDEYLYDEYGNPIPADGYYGGETYASPGYASPTGKHPDQPGYGGSSAHPAPYGGF
jgi:hypothetical protein